MKKTVNDANVRELSATYGELAYTWRVTRDFIDSVERNANNGDLSREELKTLDGEKLKLLNKNHELVVKMETIGNSILEEIGTSSENSTRETQLLVKEFLNAEIIKEFKKVYEAINGESEPNA